MTSHLIHLGVLTRAGKLHVRIHDNVIFQIFLFPPTKSFSLCDLLPVGGGRIIFRLQYLPHPTTERHGSCFFVGRSES